MVVCLQPDQKVKTKTITVKKNNNNKINKLKKTKKTIQNKKTTNKTTNKTNKQTKPHKPTTLFAILPCYCFSCVQMDFKQYL